MDTVPPEVHLLADTFGRTTASLMYKMHNLEGSLGHGQAEEPLLYIRLARDPELYAALYTVVIEAARAEDFGPDKIPDFLALVGAQESLALLGQDELGSTEVDQVLAENSAERDRLLRVYRLNEADTSRLVEQRVRVGQNRFAGAVLERFRQTCGFCGFSPGALQGRGLLRASHIKPWAKSTDRERLDPQNGICACPTHDSAFDSGLLSVDGNLMIHRSPALEAEVSVGGRFADFFGSPPLHQRLVLPRGVKPPRRRYLEYHRTEVYRR